MTKAETLTQEFIHGRLDSSREAVEAALLSIYERQTQEERLGRRAVETNGVGFSKFDAEFCTSLVEQLKRGRHLTPKQLEVARRKMKRYWRQLITVMTTDLPTAMVDVGEPAVAPLVPGASLVGPTDEMVQRALDAYGSW